MADMTLEDLSREVDELLDLDVHEIPSEVKRYKGGKNKQTFNGHGKSSLINNNDKKFVIDDDSPQPGKSRKKRREKRYGDETNSESVPDLLGSKKLPQQSKSMVMTVNNRNSWDDDDSEVMEFTTIVDKAGGRLKSPEPIDCSTETFDVHKSTSKSRARRREGNNGTQSIQDGYEMEGSRNKKNIQKFEEIEDTGYGPRSRRRQQNQESNGTDTISKQRQNRRKKKYGEESVQNAESGLQTLNDTMDDVHNSMDFGSSAQRRSHRNTDDVNRRKKKVLKKQEVVENVEEEDVNERFGTKSQSYNRQQRSMYDNNDDGEDDMYGNGFNERTETVRKSQSRKKKQQSVYLDDDHNDDFGNRSAPSRKSQSRRAKPDDNSEFYDRSESIRKSQSHRKKHKNIYDDGEDKPTAVSKSHSGKKNQHPSMYGDNDDDDDGLNVENEALFKEDTREPITLSHSLKTGGVVKYTNGVNEDNFAEETFAERGEPKRKSHRHRRREEDDDSNFTRNGVYNSSRSKRRNQDEVNLESSMQVDDNDEGYYNDSDRTRASFRKQKHTERRDSMDIDDVHDELYPDEKKSQLRASHRKKRNAEMDYNTQRGSCVRSSQRKERKADVDSRDERTDMRTKKRDEYCYDSDEDTVYSRKKGKIKPPQRQGWGAVDDEESEDEEDQGDAPRSAIAAFHLGSEDDEDSDSLSQKKSAKSPAVSSREVTDIDTDDGSRRPRTGHQSRPPTGRRPPMSKEYDATDRPPSRSGSKPPRPSGTSSVAGPTLSAGTPTIRRKMSNASNYTRRSSNASFYVPPNNMEISTGNLTGIFQIDGHAYDVVLNDEKISYSSVSGSNKVPKARRTTKKFGKRRSTSLKDLGASLEEDNAIYFNELLGAAIKRMKHQKTHEGVGVCQGIALYMYEQKEATKLRDFVMVLEHPDESLCSQWVLRIQNAIHAQPNRPHRVKTYIQPFAGRKFARSVHNDIVRPLFKAAGIEEEIVEVDHNEKVKQDMIHTDLCDLDAIICLGGDGTVHAVLNGLLNRTQYEFENERRPGFTPNRACIPLGIIPCGTTNQIVQTVQGIDDVSTAVIHIVLGHRQNLDVSSIYHDEKFHSWAFNCHYGFFGSVLPFLHDFSLFGSKKLEAAIGKALKKTKFKAYECDIQYMLDGGNKLNAKKGVACRRGCKKCFSGDPDDLHNLPPVTTHDAIQSLQDDDDSDNSVIHDATKKNPWKALKGEFLSVSVLSNAAYAHHAPYGMSPLSHLNDGCLDLITVRRTDRQEFVRYLKRHGKPMHKNQMDLPFIDVFRCKEVRFSIRLKETWNHVDHEYSEIDYRVETGDQKQKTIHRTNTETVISDLADHESDPDSVDDDDDDDDDDDLDNGSEPREEKEIKKKKKSIFHVTKANTDEPAKPRPTYAEIEMARRKKIQEKKEKKEKIKAERRMKSLWNVDNEVCAKLDLHFRVHCGLVSVFGDGVDPAYKAEEVRMPCLNML